MDIDTIIIIGFLALALSWFFSILINEERKLIVQSKKYEIDRRERADRIKSLTNKI